MLGVVNGYPLTFLYQQPWLSSYWGIWTPVWSWARLRNVEEFLLYFLAKWSWKSSVNYFEKEVTQVTLPCSRDSLMKKARSTTNKRVLARDRIMSDLFIIFLVFWTLWLVVRLGNTSIVWAITAPLGFSLHKLIVSCWGSQFVYKALHNNCLIMIMIMIM